MRSFFRPYFFVVSAFVLASVLFVTIELLHAIDVYRVNNYDVLAVSSAFVDEANTGRDIFVSGFLQSAEPIKDGLTGVTTNGLKMMRTVSMYQWDQKSYQGDGDGRVYRPVWSTSLLPSFTYNEREYINPSARVYQDSFLVASQIQLGAYSVDPVYIVNQNPTTSGEVTGEILPHFTVSDNQLYTGDVTDPQVGDVRISYEILPAREVTILGQQQGSHIVPAPLSHVRMLAGERAMTDFFLHDYRLSAVYAWIARVLAFALFLYVGFYFREVLSFFFEKWFRHIRLPVAVPCLLFALWWWGVLFCLSWLLIDFFACILVLGLCVLVTLLLLLFYRVES